MIKGQNMKQKFETSDGWIKVPVDLNLYPVQSIHSSGYAFMDKAFVKLEEEKKGVAAVWLKPKSKVKDLEQLALEFCEELLSYAHYFTSLKANGENMKILLQRALFSASPSMVKEAEEKEIENLIKELEAEEDQGPAKTKKSSRKA